jgi:hypothetical protein
LFESRHAQARSSRHPALWFGIAGFRRIERCTCRPWRFDQFVAAKLCFSAVFHTVSSAANHGQRG